MLPKIWLSPPHMGGRELTFVHNAFAENWIAPLGPAVDGFEKDITDFVGVKYAAALSSGTSALHLALILLGVARGDTVICQSLTFCGTANPVAYTGAIPVFVDSEKETWNICPVALEKAIRDRLRKGKKPKAIIYVHLYGMPAKVKELQDIAAKYEIPLIEDAAEALGSMYMDENCGNLGLISILSFNGNKIITTSGGGALLSNNAEYVSKARFLATQARDPAPYYQHSVLGYNYRMSNICASIGRGQMTTLPDKVRKRRENFQWYKEIFKRIPGIEFQPEPTESISNRWLTCILINEKEAGLSNEDLRHAFEENNIEARPVWKPMHLQPVFKDAPFYGNGNSESMFRKGLCLPSGSSLDEEEKNRIEEVIHKVFDHAVYQPNYNMPLVYA